MFTMQLQKGDCLMVDFLDPESKDRVITEGMVVSVMFLSYLVQVHEPTPRLLTVNKNRFDVYADLLIGYANDPAPKV